VPHCNAIVNGDGIELGCKTTQLFDFLFDKLSDFVQMHMTRHKLRKGVDNGNDGFAHVFGLHAVGTPQRTSAGHSSPRSTGKTSQRYFILPVRMIFTFFVVHIRMFVYVFPL
jgi:hypothetical protein